MIPTIAPSYSFIEVYGRLQRAQSQENYAKLIVQLSLLYCRGIRRYSRVSHLSISEVVYASLTKATGSIARSTTWRHRGCIKLTVMRGTKQRHIRISDEVCTAQFSLLCAHQRSALSIYPALALSSTCCAVFSIRYSFDQMLNYAAKKTCMGMRRSKR